VEVAARPVYEVEPDAAGDLARQGVELREAPHRRAWREGVVDAKNREIRDEVAMRELDIVAVELQLRRQVARCPNAHRSRHSVARPIIELRRLVRETLVNAPRRI